MPPNRYLRICLSQLVETVIKGKYLKKYNYAAQVNEIICGIGYAGEWERLKRNRKGMVAAYRLKRFYEDRGKVYSSIYSDLYRQFYLPHLTSAQVLHMPRSAFLFFCGSRTIK